MSTGVPDSDPHADSGDRGFDVQPAVPGWSAGQDWYTGPIYDDTGWNIDLSNVEWAGNRKDSDRDRPGGGSPTLRFGDHDLRDRNGAAPQAVGPDYPAGSSRRDRPAVGPARAPFAARGRDPAAARRPDQRAAPSDAGRTAEDPAPPGSAIGLPEARSQQPGYQQPAWDPDGYDAPAYQGPAGGPSAPTQALPPRGYAPPSRPAPVWTEPEPGYAEPGYDEPGRPARPGRRAAGLTAALPMRPAPPGRRRIAARRGHAPQTAAGPARRSRPGAPQQTVAPPPYSAPAELWRRARSAPG